VARYAAGSGALPPGFDLWEAYDAKGRVSPSFPVIVTPFSKASAKLLSMEVKAAERKSSGSSLPSLI
jgi:hypothetical protein